MNSFEMSLDLEIKVEVHRYIPERTAPECRNSSSFYFSDDGDKEEIEFDAFWIWEDKEIPMDERMTEALREEIENKIKNEVRNG